MYIKLNIKIVLVVLRKFQENSFYGPKRDYLYWLEARLSCFIFKLILEYEKGV